MRRGRSREINGSIPAHTGERHQHIVCRRWWWVYPRTYGGTQIRGETLCMTTGLSPHIRGNVDYHRIRGGLCGSIPAHTGERMSLAPRDGTIRVYPRTYGGTRRYVVERFPHGGLSPHIRGNGSGEADRRLTRGSIPAHTGERTAMTADFNAAWVYPRTYGGTSQNASTRSTAAGLSPHIRGNGRLIQRPGNRFGSIPAHTGERYDQIRILGT